jgi:hypothetical protein
MPEDVIIRLPGRLRASLEQIARKDFRRSPSDADSILERSITDRAMARGITNRAGRTPESN